MLIKRMAYLATGIYFLMIIAIVVLYLIGWIPAWAMIGGVCSGQIIFYIAIRLLS